MLNNTWTPEEYSVSQLMADIDKKTIRIPEYQREIVWDKDKKNALWDTIKMGYPFGSILIYEDSDGKKQLIDGLQRCSTIFEFISNPSRCFNDDDIDDAIITKIVKLIGFREEDQKRVEGEVKEKLIKWVKEEHPTMEALKEIKAYKFAHILAKDYPNLSATRDGEYEVAELLETMLNEYKKVCDFVMQTKIPVIKLSGDKDNLPEIFELINSTGATLTKYQIYKAAWSVASKIKILKPELEKIIDYVCERSDVAVGGIFQIENYDSTQLHKDKELGLYDLCFGFGKLLCEKYPHLFGYSDNKIKVESVGFALVNACLGFRVNDMKKLHTNIFECLQDSKTINEFLYKILLTTAEVDKILRVVTTFKGNRKEDIKITESTINHTEMQIVSIIAFAFIQKYVSLTIDENGDVIERKIDLSAELSTWKSKKKLFENNCIKLYTIDCLQAKWRGSGDKKLNNIILEGSYYYRDISWNTFEANLDLWFNSILQERTEDRRVATPKEAERIILNLVHANTFRGTDILRSKPFDIEHLAPKDRLKKALDQLNNGKAEGDKLKLPISSVGNLCYLPEECNRSKKAKTIYEDNDYLNGRSIQTIEERYSFTIQDDFNWLSNPSQSQQEFKDAYIAFVTKRWGKMKEKIKETLNEK